MLGSNTENQILIVEQMDNCMTANTHFGLNFDDPSDSTGILIAGVNSPIGLSYNDALLMNHNINIIHKISYNIFDME